MNICKRICQRAVVLSTVFVFGLVGAQSEYPKLCSEMAGFDTQAIINYLAQARKGLKPDCVASSIDWLWSKKSVQSVPVLTSYLDFERPGYQTGKITERLPSISMQYPAILALRLIGANALHGVLDAIVNDGSSKLLRYHALLVIRFLTWPEVTSAVQLLNDANKAAKDPSRAARLLEAAKSIADECPEQVRPECKAVLWDQSRK